MMHITHGEYRASYVRLFAKGKLINQINLSIIYLLKVKLEPFVISKAKHS